ncbi:helix-turn-helix domain-containing protein [Cecembia calidifontis]|uniref:AraC family transcriptional regulator n=1 Tax=Cecembia calidifontis TaxID=1187080 RepID=A0A4Q7P9A6_9BACT|nr:AraC family transcriptional regulator [Cecembia calidifontis]RZS96786.1 AraC family transcriptional regulator [Cecembia calidifontis]
MKKSTERQLSPYNTELKLKGFNAFQIEADGAATKMYSRKDFYKICLTTGKSKIHYADRSFEHEGTILFFGNPHIPYSWETISRTYVGYTCLFSEEFFKVSERSESILQSPLFKLGGTPIFDINEQQRDTLNEIFRKMIDEQESEYPYKDELIRNYIQLIIHEAMKLQPAENVEEPKNAAHRLTAVFLELLERQFPIESADAPLSLRSPKDFADALSVHVNHLNRSVKQVTGKSTSTHISERIANEAKALLQYTDWNISEVGYSLGFEYPTYFNNFFKRIAGTTPKSIRDFTA